MFRKLILYFAIIAVVRYHPQLIVESAQIVTKIVGQLITDSINVEKIPVGHRFKPSALLPEYARQLAECGKAGPRVRALTASFAGTPKQKLIAAYDRLRTSWTYRHDDGHEELQSAEASLGPLKLHGDCEDFAAVIMATLSSIEGLTSRIVICHGKSEGKPGHAFCEVLIASDVRTAAPFLHRLRTAWNLPELVCRTGSTGVWVPLDFVPPGTVYDGPVYCFITENGEVAFPAK